jgi:hypothetical protein
MRVLGLGGRLSRMLFLLDGKVGTCTMKTVGVLRMYQRGFLVSLTVIDALAWGKLAEVHTNITLSWFSSSSSLSRHPQLLRTLRGPAWRRGEIDGLSK